MTLRAIEIRGELRAGKERAIPHRRRTGPKLAGSVLLALALAASGCAGIGSGPSLGGTGRPDISYLPVPRG